DPLLPIALTRLAASAPNVEAEPAGRIAARPRLWKLGEEVADGSEQAGVGGGIRARRAADRILVNADDLVEMLSALDAVVLGWGGEGAEVAGGEGGVEDVIHQGALAGAGDAGQEDEHGGREEDRDIAEIVRAGAHHGDSAARFHCAPGCRH